MSKSAVPKPSNRVFQGNLNFINFYNKEVKEFFSPDYSDSGFKTSKVFDSGASYVGDLDYKNREGSTWTPEEKEIFFTLLSRYSSTGYELIAEGLPNKSVIEIVNYINVLKKELNRLKRKYRKKRIYRLRSGDPKLDNKSLKIITQPRSLIKYSQIPIAYEVSDYFLQFEEVQSALVSKLERSKSNDENQRFKSHFKKYISREDESGAIINHSLAGDMTEVIFKHNQITPLKNSKLTPKLQFKSLVFLEELISAFTKSILSCIIGERISTTWLNQRGKPQYICIKKKDIERATNVNRLSKTRRPVTLEAFFTDIKDNMNIQTQSGPSENGSESSKSTDTESSLHLNTPESKVFNDQPLYSFQDKITMGPFISSNSLPRASPQKGNIPLISAFSNNSRKRKKLDPYANNLALKLEIDAEKRFNKSDKLESRMHEHALLTYFSFHNSDIDPRINESQFSDEDASLLLKEWDGVRAPSGEIHSDETNNGNDLNDLFQEEASSIDLILDDAIIENFDYEFANYSDSEESSRDY